MSNDRKPLIPLDLGRLGEQWTADADAMPLQGHSNANPMLPSEQIKPNLEGLSKEIVKLINENTGLTSNQIYYWIQNYCEKNNIHLPERDAIYARLKYLMKKGYFTRVRENNSVYLFVPLRK